jgi:RimJ/RimL family protein N-acetyltransferase
VEGATDAGAGDRGVISFERVLFERVYDLELVREMIAGDPRVYSLSSDDAAPERTAFRPNTHPAIWYVVAADELGVIGLFVLVPQNAVTWEMHVTRAFGGRAVAAGRLILPWLFAELPGCRRIVAAIAGSNRVALRYAEAIGFRRFGVNESSFLRNGQLLDQVLLGVSKI